MGFTTLRSRLAFSGLLGLSAGSLALGACFDSGSVPAAPGVEEPLEGGPFDAQASLDSWQPTVDSGAPVPDSESPDSGSSDAGSSSEGGLVVAPSPGTCVATGSMSAGRSFSLSGSLGDGRVLIAGGGGNLTTAEIYDPAQGTFTPTGSMTTFRWGYPNPLVQLPDGRFLVAGGTDPQCTTALSTAEIYDPTAGTWSATGAMTAARSNPVLVTLGSGQVLVRGGYGQVPGVCGEVRSNALTSAELYDPSSGTFSLTGSASSPRAAAASTLLPSGEALIVDGEQYGNSPFNSTAEVYTWGADGGIGGAFTWNGTVPGNAGYSYAFTLPSGRALLSGSYNGGTVSLFDPATDMFLPAAQDLISGGGGCGIRLKSGDVFLATGYPAGIQTSQTEVYQASTGTWTELGKMTASRWVCSIAELPDGNVLIAGGNDPSGTPLATAEVCNPRPASGPGGDGGVADAADAADAASDAPLE
jgi:WD40 repeat protein